MCAFCEAGWCERHARGARYILDFDPFWVSVSEEAAERDQELMGRPDFGLPWRDA